MRSITLIFAVLSAGRVSCSYSPEDQPVSNIKSDERIVFSTTDAWLSEDRRSWTVPIHAWVYEPETTSVRKAALAVTLKTKHGLEATAETKANFDRRTQLFVVDNERGKRPVVQLAGKVFSLPKTQPNGHTTSHIQLDMAAISGATQDGKLTYSVVLPTGDTRKFQGNINVVSPKGISVISDLDDTVKVTEVTDRKAMLDRTFFRDFEAVPGMAKLYTSWAKRGVAFHFVSSSPCHLYGPLDEFLTESGFPARSLSLKLVRLKDETFWDIFKNGAETKPKQILPILKMWPQRRFILVGDSGQQDPEVYAAILRKFPKQIERVYIRNVTGAASTDERFLKVFAEIDPEKWKLFTDPAELVLPN